jgi:hypothetical protein
MKLMKKQWAFNTEKWIAAGTKVQVTRSGKGGARDRSQVMDADGNLMVVFNVNLLPDDKKETP